MKKEMTKSDRNLLAALWVIVGVLARLLPHPPNVTPLTSISLFGGTQLSARFAFLVTFAAMILSDLLLAQLQGHAAFGYWSLFTYSGFAAVILAGRLLRANPSAARTFALILGSSVGFWLWTNLGTWLVSGMYTRDLAGLSACYAMALPFLANSVAGDLVWGSAFFLSFAGVRKLAPRYGWAVQGA